MEGLDALKNKSRIGCEVSSRLSIDCVYIAACATDARYTRICVASIRYFYPDIPVRLLVSGNLQRGLAKELQRHWDVGIEDLPGRGEYGWGFVKLEPLFGRPEERFLVLDSDTVLTGPILDCWSDTTSHFLVDDEEQSEADTKRLYYDWEKVRLIDTSAQPPHFVFNSGQWFGTAGVLTRSDFAPWVDWRLPRQLRYPELFMPGDQGILNYVFNQKETLEGLRVGRQPIMRWPANSMKGLDAATISKRTAPPQIVHWAGLKKARVSEMPGADLLAFYEKVYYERLPAAGAQRTFASCRHVVSHKLVESKVRTKLAIRKYVTWARAFLA
jgi:hypothetical protein